MRATAIRWSPMWRAISLTFIVPAAGNARTWLKTVVNGFTFDGAMMDPVQKAVRDSLIAQGASRDD
jgi:hypothetical protein